MKRELFFDEEPITKEREHFVMEDGADTFQIVSEQIIDPVLEANQENRKQFRGSRSAWQKGDFLHAARIPMPLVMELKRQGILDDKKEFIRWLNKPENEMFRSRPGRV